MKTEPATYTEDQVIEAILTMLERRTFAQWYNEGGQFAKWIEGVTYAPTDENIRQQLKLLLRLSDIAR